MSHWQNERCDWFYDWLSDSPTIARLAVPSRLSVVPEASADNGLILRVYGFDANQRRVFGPDGQDGYPVQANTTPSASIQGFARIERVSKPASKGYVGLYAWNQLAGTLGIKLGDYAPADLEPSFRRIRTNRPCASIRIAYRKRDRNIVSLTDVINLRSKPAIVNAVMALSVRLTDPERAQALLMQAVQWLKDEQAQRDQSMPPRAPEHFGQMDQTQDWVGFY